MTDKDIDQLTGIQNNHFTINGEKLVLSNLIGTAGAPIVNNNGLRVGYDWNGAIDEISIGIYSPIYTIYKIYL